MTSNPNSAIRLRLPPFTSPSYLRSVNVLRERKFRCPPPLCPFFKSSQLKSIRGGPLPFSYLRAFLAEVNRPQQLLYLVLADSDLSRELPIPGLRFTSGGAVFSGNLPVRPCSIRMFSFPPFLRHSLRRGFLPSRWHTVGSCSPQAHPSSLPSVRNSFFTAVFSIVVSSDHWLSATRRPMYLTKIEAGSSPQHRVGVPREPASPLEVGSEGLINGVKILDEDSPFPRERAFFPTACICLPHK